MRLVMESQCAAYESIKVLRELAEAERNFARALRLCGNTQAAKTAEDRAVRFDAASNRSDKRLW